MSQNAAAHDRAQQAALHSGTQVNYFLTPHEARATLQSAPSINVPRRPAPARVVGRSSVVGQVTEAVMQTRSSPTATAGISLVLCGLGGVGKSTCAIEVAHQLKDAGYQIWWVHAEAASRWPAALHAVAVAAGAQMADFDLAHPADVLWKAFERSTSPWALFVDGADDPGQLFPDLDSQQSATGWLRVPGPGNFICVSTRDCRPDRWGEWMTIQEVSSLNDYDGAKVLWQSSPGAGTMQEAAVLSRRLGGLPLALTLAGRYLSRRATDPFPDPRGVDTFAQYSSMLTDRLGPVDQTADGPVDDLRQILRTTWEISLEGLDREGLVLARPLLEFMSLLGEAPVPYIPVLKAGMRSAENTWLSRADSREISTNLRALDGLSLIDLHSGGGVLIDPAWQRTLTLHPVVTVVTRANLRRDARYRPMFTLMIDALVSAVGELSLAAEDWPKWELLADPVAAVIGALETDQVSEMLLRRAIGLGQEVAWYRYLSGQFRQSASDFRDLADVASRLLGQNDAQHLQALACLARSLRESGRAQEAEQLLTDVSARCAAHLGNDNVITLESQVSLGRTIRERGDDAKAKVLLRSVLDVALPVLGPDHELPIVARLNIAACLQHQQRYAEAGPYYDQALRDWTSTRSENDLMALDMRYEICENNRLRGDDTTVAAEYPTLLTAAIMELGAKHPNSIIIRHGLARYLESQGRLVEAFRELQTVVELRVETLGDAHPAVRDALRDLERLSTLLEDRSDQS